MWDRTPIHVENESRERLGHNVLCDDEQRLSLSDHRLENRQQLGHGRQFIVDGQNIGLGEGSRLGFGFVGQQRRDETCMGMSG